LVRNVRTRIQKAVEKYMNDNGWGKELEGYAWEFNLIDEETVNAWAMPGGKVAFYTGIMPICKDEKGIAVVMGHEVAHAIANHGRECMSQSMAAQYGLVNFRSHGSKSNRNPGIANAINRSRDTVGYVKILKNA